MKVEIDKIDKLLNRSFAEANLIMPALDLALEKKQISNIEFQVMRIGMKKNIFQAKDIEHLIPASSSRGTCLAPAWPHERAKTDHGPPQLQVNSGLDN